MSKSNTNNQLDQTGPNSGLNLAYQLAQKLKRSSDPTSQLYEIPKKPKILNLFSQMIKQWACENASYGAGFCGAGHEWVQQGGAN